MKTRKEELVERTFIPFEITITVESEKELEKLKKDINDIHALGHHTRFRLGNNALDKMLSLILSHTK